ncbi:uncharacterized protein LOC143276463 [Babylonia areolata]|uniref:uncharacterized protein LOC143276463 n=1 Tax=Babylonia areolata TaxID=304850 RepID=UPI003FCEF455
MESSQMAQALIVLLSCLLLSAVYCDQSQQDSLLDGDDAAAAAAAMAPSHPQKRSVADLPTVEDSPYQALYGDRDLLADDKRSSLFRFGKRGSLFRFGKRGSLFRFGKRSSLFRFGKRGSLFRFGKRDGGELEGDWVLFPAAEADLPTSVAGGSEDEMKRDVKSFHWGRERDE